MRYTGYVLVAFIIIAGGWWLLGTNRGQSLAQNAGGNAHEMDTQRVQDESDADATADANISASMSMTAAPDVIVDVSGANFRFSKEEIRVKEGDIVQINFTSGDMRHDWVVDEFDARTAIVQAGESSSVTFVADKKGRFEYYCSVGQHRANGMVGTLIVE